MMHQIPWFERTFNFDTPPGLFPVIIERLRGTSPRIADMVCDASDSKLSAKIDGDWSIKEHVGHLYDLEELWLGRIEDFLSRKEKLRPADLSNRKTNEANHNRLPVHDLLHIFTIARNQLINKISDFDEATISITSVHPRLLQPMRLIDSLFFVAEHDDHHLAKMRSLLTA